MKKTKRKKKSNKLADLVDFSREKSPVPPDFADYMDAITRPMIRYWLAGQALVLLRYYTITDLSNPYIRQEVARVCCNTADAVLAEIAEREKQGR